MSVEISDPTIPDEVTEEDVPTVEVTIDPDAPEPVRAEPHLVFRLLPP